MTAARIARKSAEARLGCETGWDTSSDCGRHAVTTPPDFGGREIEEGLAEDLGGPKEEHPVEHLDEDASAWDDNEEHAAGQVCARCGAVITASQEARRRADGHWMHETCPAPGA
jgi:hypothetical protein